MDISKAFGKVWHDGLIYKFKQRGIQDKLLFLLMNFQKNHQQREFLNGQFSSWTEVNAGLPQGILGLLLFLTYIKDLRNGLQSNPKLYAGNTSLFSTVQDITLSTVNLCILIKISRNIGLTRKLQPIIPSAAFLTIYKSFLRTQLAYRDVIYDRTFNKSFSSTLESIQHNVALPITGAIRGSSKQTFSLELGLELLKSQQWY